MSIKPLEQWVEETCPELGRDVATHISAFHPEVEQASLESLWRMIMISIRQHWRRDPR